MEKQTQSFSSHTKWDPKFHFVAMPLFTINLIYRVYQLIATEVSIDSIWEVVFALALLVALFTIRVYSLRVQDRLIRLEERLRLQSVLAEPLRSRVGELTEGQLIGLRFASDGELPDLVEKTLKGSLGAKEIKKAIKQWRPDNFRV